MIIGISGKIGSGKDTIGKIIQYLQLQNSYPIIWKNQNFDQFLNYGKEHGQHTWESDWQIKKFADKLKDIVCLLIGCTREQLEDIDFKNKELGEEWIRYAVASGFTKDHNGKTTMLTTDCDKERYELELRINWQTAYKVHYTPRLLLQRLGTEAGRGIIHSNIWVNATFANYKADWGEPKINQYPNWIITDLRFPNEAQAIKDRGGILIRVDRKVRPASQEELNEKVINKTYTEHESETALDNYDGFDYTIDNNSNIEKLVEMVKEILIKEKII